MNENKGKPLRSYRGRVVHYDGASGETRLFDIAVEKAINLTYGDAPYAVMMATPADLEDFVVGFSLTEGVIAHISEIRGVDVAAQEDGWVASVSLTPDALRRHMARRRNMSGRTSCGICGVESLDQIPAAMRPVAGARPTPEAIERALQILGHAQPMFNATRATHAAAWCNKTGALAIVREDVGRHNALDKTIGACLRAGVTAQDGFLLITSRCSFEMIEKAAIFGAPAVASVSAPTSLAIDRARALGVALFAVARDDGAILFDPRETD